jgi:hypothetical protein
MLQDELRRDPPPREEEVALLPVDNVKPLAGEDFH